VRALAVPQQLSVVGFGDLAFAADLEPALSTVRIKGDAIGRQAARFIVDRVEGRSVPERVIDIGFSLVQRQSG
jgi:LacI family gluconate utilization system Gnt-I transcriptional repressor